MEFELWWLLGFPLFFVLGWLAARIDIQHFVRDARALPSSYFKGLNFLLNEQPDKAIEAFIEVVKVDPETVELHFALGSLFRRRPSQQRPALLLCRRIEPAHGQGRFDRSVQVSTRQPLLRLVLGLLDAHQRRVARLVDTRLNRQQRGQRQA